MTKTFYRLDCISLEEHDNKMHFIYHHNGGDFHAYIPNRVWGEISHNLKIFIQKKLNNEYKYTDTSPCEEEFATEDYTCYFIHQKDENQITLDFRFPGGTTFDFGLFGDDIITFMNMISPEPTIQELESELGKLHLQLCELDGKRDQFSDKVYLDKRHPINSRTLEVVDLLVQMKLKNFIKSLNDYEIGNLEGFASDPEGLYEMIYLENLSRDNTKVPSAKTKHEQFIHDLTKSVEHIDASFLPYSY